MGKKSKQKKLRANKPAQAATTVHSASNRTGSALGDALFSDSPAPVAPAASRSGNAKTAIVTDYGYIRVEIRRILLYLLLVVSLLAAATIVNARTSWLGTAGAEVARVIGLRR